MRTTRLPTMEGGEVEYTYQYDIYTYPSSPGIPTPAFQDTYPPPPPVNRHTHVKIMLRVVTTNYKHFSVMARVADRWASDLGSILG